MYHANIVALAALQHAGQQAPVLWNIRRALDDYSERQLMTRFVIRSNAWLSALPSQIVYCSTECQVQHEAVGFSRGRGVVLQNGFDTARFAPSGAARSDFRARHGIADDEFVIGMVGRYDIAKGYPYLLEAFGRLAPILPKARLVLVGRGMDNQNREVAALVSSAGMNQRVLLLGEQDGVESVYPGFDLYCSSSLNEGFPNALSEAMSCGVPCVATDTGASRELVEGIGIVTRSRRADELAEGIVAMASLGEVELRSRAERSRERIVSRYALDRIVRQYRDLYAGLACRA
jgi:glycosyltransferase involved in cell wall biosynthesis